MPSTMKEIEATKQADAKADFCRAALDGATPNELTALAEAAGLDGTAADRLLTRLAMAARDIATCDDIPTLQADAEAVAAKLVEDRSRIIPQIESLSEELRRSHAVADAAKTALYTAERAAQRLIQLHDSNDLPTDRLPEIAQAAIARRERRAAVDKAHATHRKAIEIRDRIRRVLVHRESPTRVAQLVKVSEKRQLTTSIEAARQELVEAEANVQTTEAAWREAVAAAKV